MNREDIIRIAREAGYAPLPGFDFANSLQEAFIERFASLVAAAEREAFAKWLDERGAPNWAEQIRARGQA